MHKLSARAQGNPACAIILRRKREALISLPPSLREVPNICEAEGVILLCSPQRKSVVWHVWLRIRRMGRRRGRSRGGRIFMLVQRGKQPVISRLRGVQTFESKIEFFHRDDMAGENIDEIQFEKHL